MKGRYETIVVGAPSLTDDEMSALVGSLENSITEGKGTIIQTEPWGKRRLAYRVKKFDEGHYVRLFYESEPSVVRELERRIRMNDSLIRFLTVKVDWEEKVALAEAQRALRRRPGAASVVEDSGFVDGIDPIDAGELEGGQP